MRRHAFSTLGRRRVDHITVADIQAVIGPIWEEIPDMARKVRQRIGTVLNYAHSKGWRAAGASGKSVSMGSAKRGAGGNSAAMPYADVPAFVSSIMASPEALGRLVLKFTIYTAARSGETRHAC